MVWPHKVFSIQCWELLELVESRAMSSVLRKLLPKDGQEGGGASQRSTARGQEAARKRRQKPRPRYKKSKELAGVKGNSKGISHKARKRGFRAKALRGGMARTVPPHLPYSSKGHLYLWPNQDSTSPLSRNLVIQVLTPRQTEMVKVDQHSVLCHLPSSKIFFIKI